MTELAPDIKELKEAEKLLKAIGKTLDKLNSQLDEMKDLGPRSVLAPAATHYKDLSDLEDLIEQARIKAYHLKNFYQFHVLPPLFHDASVDTVKTLNGYNVAIAEDISVSIPADQKPEAYTWLQENGYGDIITTTVNSSTLKATMKEILKDGVIVPEETFKVTTLNKYRVTQSAKKNPSFAGGSK